MTSFFNSGEATALLFADHDCKVVCADIDINGAEKTANEINQSYPGCAIAIQCDVSKEADSKRVVEECVKKFGKIDCYFANAGVLGKFVPLEKETEESFIKTLMVNTLGPFMAIKYASKAMKETSGGGSIVCTASIAAIRSDLTPIQYAASKGAVISTVIATNERLLLDNVRVNGILPGGVATPMVFGVQKQLDELGLHLPGFDMDRYPPSSPSDIANVVLFLCSDESCAIKGHCIVADGGMSLSMGSQPLPQEKKKKAKKA